MAHAAGELKELKCTDAGGYCDFVARTRSEEEAIEIITDHIGLRHGIWEIVSQETMWKWRSLMRGCEPGDSGGWIE
ncbi:MAG TPA: DUF1059 domain-containing protein [Thermodesulfobacteriota bacterium]|nr:DUF1059 domain-containing protein [Thermodesulfobacteriota bacterium]